MHLKLRREQKEDYKEVGENKVRIRLIKPCALLRMVRAYLKGVLT